MKRNKKSGFTLVELMVVAVIVAILAAVAIPLMTGNKERAAATEGQAGCSTIQTAQRVYRAEHGSYYTATTDPTDLPGINTGDLEGEYFDDGNYVMSGQSANGFTITATSNGENGVDVGTVILTVTLTDSEWSGTLLD